MGITASMRRYMESSGATQEDLKKDSSMLPEEAPSGALGYTTPAPTTVPQQQQQGVLNPNPYSLVPTPESLVSVHPEGRKVELSNLTDETKDFLKEREGFKTDMYVPIDEETNKVLDSSGPTIASGFDLGQRNISDLKSYELGPELTEKLKPYLGLKGTKAKEYIEKNPLKLTEEEANVINTKVKQKEADKLEKKFNANSKLEFKSLPDEIKTMISSVVFQYGIEGIEKKEVGAPNWWKQVTSGDWEGAYNNLRKFGDKYTTRRNTEANLIAPLLKKKPITDEKLWQ